MLRLDRVAPAALRPPRPSVALALAFILLAGCAITRETESPEELRAQRQRFIAGALADRIALSAALVSRAGSEIEAAEAGGEPARLDFLILSGGGDYGAFGAGVLTGWAEVADPEMTRPEFDFVSGVSTGALIAPLAFAGTPECYEAAFQVYQHPKKDWFRERGILNFLLRRVSYVDNAGLIRDMEATIDADVIARVAAEAKEHRALFIGTTNLDQGMMRMFDVGSEARRIAEQGASPDRLYDILMASATIPGAFPPVEIDGDLYVDGGVTRNIAYLSDQEFIGSAVNAWRIRHPRTPFPKVRIWVIVNNQLGTPEQTVQPGWPALMGRSLSISIRASTHASMKVLERTSELLSARGDQSVEFRYLAIPDEWRPPAPGVFVEETMVALAELGREMGREPGSWQTRVPDPESPVHTFLEPAAESP